MTNWQKAILAGVLAQLIWGVAGPLVKIVLYSVPPFSLLFLRCLFTSLILFFFYEKKWAKKYPLPFFTKGQSLPKEDLKDIFLAGFLGVFVNIALYFWGQSLTTVVDAWVITSTGTIFIVTYSYLFLKERLSKTVYYGIILAFIGTLVIIGSPILKIGSGSILGNILLLGATLGSAASFLIIRRLMDKYPPLLLTFYFFLTSLFCSLPLFLIEYMKNPSWLTNLPPSSFLILIYLILGSSIGAYSLVNFSLRYLSASIASTITYIGAAVSIFLSIFFLGERLTPFFLGGTILIIIGLFFAETRHPSHPIHKFLKK